MKKSHQEPRSSSSCAACKLLKRRCTPNCQFAPYFRSSDEPNKFAKVHKVFGASNVSKILNEVPEQQREDTVNSLVYEADVRLRDPVYGCIGAIASLQKKMDELQHDLFLARARLAYCATSSSGNLGQGLYNNNSNNSVLYFDDHHQYLNNNNNSYSPPYTEISPTAGGGGLEDQSFDQNSYMASSTIGQNYGFVYDFGQFPFL